MINKDKIYHFIVGFIVTILVTGITTFLWLGLIVGLTVSVGKEVYDYMHPEDHTTDGMDFIATVVGVLVAVVGYMSVLCLVG